MFHDNILVVCTIWHIFISILANKLSWNTFKMSNKLNKIWLKELNLHISKIEKLN